MIYTITSNPTLSYIVRVRDFKLDQVNRTSYEEVYAGGKGINISIVLKSLNVENIVLGYIADFAGKEIENKIKAFGCNTDLIRLNNGMPRINVKLESSEGSEINGQGLSISNQDLEELYRKLELLREGNILVLAGSIPATLLKNIYKIIMEGLSGKRIRFIADATGGLSLNVLRHKPFLIKPNHHELAKLFDTTIENEDGIVIYAKKPREMGTQNVLISEAGGGAIFVTEKDETIKSDVPKGTLISSVGAGDSMVRDFIAGYLKNKSLEEAFKMGVATGGASAFSEGLTTKEKVYELSDQIL